MMDLGATICAPRAASCLICPLQPDCRATREGEPTLYPIKPVKAERPVRRGHAFVMTDAGGDVYLQSRPGKGLLGGMTEVPTSDWAADLSEVAYPVAGNWRHRGQVVHVFTHFRLELEVWSAPVPPESFANGWWSPPAALKGEALPTLFRKVLAQAGFS
jgi:A/G-specific adenine glycosylase